MALTMIFLRETEIIGIDTGRRILYAFNLVNDSFINDNIIVYFNSVSVITKKSRLI